MLNGSVFLRVVLLVVIAAALTGLGRYYFSHDGGLPEKPLPSASAKLPAPAAPALVPKAETPAPLPAEPQGQAPASPPGPTATLTPEPAPEPPPEREAPATIPAAPEAPKPEGQEAVTTAEDNAGARAVDLVDLNTASVTQLNGLKGGGAIGRAIVQHRPYTSVDQLLSKRVLSKAIYQRIKDQVTVR